MELGGEESGVECSVVWCRGLMCSIVYGTG